ncbi:MAG: N-acetylmuramoyl-L-alanine amidase [Bacteroidota bacterium]|nr:N-acetylmuramoyl-L-alanine amidase [Bacteroidota bacterium]
MNGKSREMILKNFRIIGLGLLTFTLGFIIPSLADFPFPSKDVGVKKVIIDAGHGGKDPGNLGTGRYKDKEKDVALDVALLVGKYIKENFPDVEVVFTRKTDHFVELHERTAIANREKADLFISIHCDAFTNPQAHGASTFVMGKGHSSKNMRVAMQENSVIYLEENFEEKYEGFDPSKPETYIALTLYQNAFLSQSINMAQKVQDQFRERVQRKDRGVQQQPLWVTSRTIMPSLLVELGFLTNKAEEDFLQSQRGKELMASAIYRAFKDYKTEQDAIDLQNLEVIEPPKIDPPLVHQEERPSTEPEPLFAEIRIQIATSGRLLDLVPQNFNGLEEVNFIKENGLYKYTYGRYHSLEEARNDLPMVKKAGYPDSFIIGILNGKKVSVEEALRKIQDP